MKRKKRASCALGYHSKRIRLPLMKVFVLCFICNTISWCCFRNEAQVVSSFTQPRRSRMKVISTVMKFSNDGAIDRNINGGTVALREDSESNHKEKSSARLPPWIPMSSKNENLELTKAQAKYNLHRLNQALEHHALCTSTFTSDDIDTVMEAVFVASKKDFRLITGAAEFLTLLLSVEEYNSYKKYAEKYLNEANMVGDEDFNVIMTRDALVAAAFHYCDCIVAREAGIYDIFDKLLWKGVDSKEKSRNDVFALRDVKTDIDLNSRSSGNHLLPSASIEVECDSITIETDANNDETSDENGEYEEIIKTAETIGVHKEDALNGELASEQALDKFNSIIEFGDGASRISQSASRVKQAEILSNSILPKTLTRPTPNFADAASLRGLLLSVAEDWRALAIRSSASLYRLKGLLHHERSSLTLQGLSKISDHQYSKEQVIREAREALYVYAPLAERLGMHRLKSELENTAFRILYRRQYNAATAIYAKSGAAIQSVTDFLTETIEHLLKDDPWLAPQLERLTVTSRVKTPYSLWRKLLKMRNKAKSRNQYTGNNESSALSFYDESSNTSITSIPDAIAIRVIVKSKTNVDEDNYLVRSREEFLCYYIQNRLLQLWPAVSPSRIKDYISRPKPNGYQSLHHTSKCFRYGSEWPFEVQVRTEEMHTKSEYGVAAHWDYKLDGIEGKKKVMLPAADTSNEDAIDSTIAIGKSSGLRAIDYAMDFSAPVLSGLKLGKVEKDDIGRLTESSSLESYINALSTAREHLLDNSIFIFFLAPDSTVGGRVIGLPSSSSIADALIEICKRCELSVPQSFDDSSFDVFRNGEAANLHDSLQNGDTLVVPSLGDRVVCYL